MVLFHFQVDFFQGGYAGVDVFFVISGFLMTKIIVSGVENGRFSLFDFYLSRAKRIVPALFFLCFFMMVFGWFYLSPLDYSALGKHVSSSILFISNFVYWTESGYFNTASQEKWLLHTWSLSAEWQFYLIYPIFILGISKVMNVRNMKRFMLLSFVFCFFIGVFLTNKSPSAAYFLLPSRAWEMIAGGVVYLYPIKVFEKYGKSFSIFGLAIIFLSYISFDKTTAWPGYLSLLPVLGSCLIIWSNNQTSFVVSNKVSQSIGNWSYSIYLWHWPLVVFGKFYSIESWAYIGIPLSVLFGFISYKTIESRIKNNVVSVKYNLYKVLLFSLSISTFGFFVNNNDGIMSRVSELDKSINKSAFEAVGDREKPENKIKVNGLELSYIDKGSEKNILFVGASHIEHIWPYVNKNSDKYNSYFLVQGGCFVSYYNFGPKWNCDNLKGYSKLFENVKFDKIVTSFYCFDCFLPIDENERTEEIINRTKGYDSFLKDLKENSREVFVILGEPKGEEFDPVLSIRKKLPKEVDVERVREKYSTQYAAIRNLREKDGVNFIDPISYLCDKSCRTMDEKYNYFYRDDSHFRPWYAETKLKYLDELFL